ncbi:hypothetical protein F5Y14DRAFT_448412 [Nemania sp. NC0429]|nr:hypothetical protein F5Y14DRAFT_448412 [Nemania sp. NC0429]
MCVHRYKVYATCQHKDPRGTPLAPQPCIWFKMMGRCGEGLRFEQVRETGTTKAGKLSLCPPCMALALRLEDSLGGLMDKQGDEKAKKALSKTPTWRLWRRIGYAHMDADLVRDARLVRTAMVNDMQLRWKGPNHGREARVRHWVDVFDEFKDWLVKRLDKRDAQGFLYFPPIEEKGARIERNKVLQHLVRWICCFTIPFSRIRVTADDGVMIAIANERYTFFPPVINLSQGHFDLLDIPTFREGLDKSFKELIYQWVIQFPQEPGWHSAKKEFTKYWILWLTKMDFVRVVNPSQKEDEENMYRNYRHALIGP